MRWLLCFALLAALPLPFALCQSNIKMTDNQSDLQYSLRLFHTHTNEHIDIVYRRGNTYLPGALEKLDYFLRDWRTRQIHHYDPHIFDLLHDLLASIGRPGEEIDVICGYRTPQTNKYLRTRHAHSGVAVHSLHMQAEAIDIRLPDFSTARLRGAALKLHRGGVGYYASSNFVHVDVGRVRHW